MDWKYVASVIDRLLLVLFLLVTVGGALGIFLQAPHIFSVVDQDSIIEKLMSSLNWCLLDYKISYTETILFVFHILEKNISV